MLDDKDKNAPRGAELTEVRDRANIETERAASFRTTIPEMVDAEKIELSTDANGLQATVVSDESSDPKSAASSRSSFSGTLGRFEFVRELGEGAFGTVVQVWDPELKTHRAVKVPHQRLIDSRKVKAELYIAEARKLAQMGRHPGIVDVLDVQRMANGTPFVVSEFVAGGSLADRMKTGQMPWRDAVDFVAHLAEAIAHAHSKGIVHRDLKPANILLTNEGKPVIVDFGLALGDDEFSYQRSVCGTYCYMSPQQIRGEADRVDGRSDIFSLGVILYQLLAGRVPYKSRDVTSLKREILQEESTPVRQYNHAVPPALEAICQKAMAKEPKDRYSTASDFAAALKQVLAAPAPPVAPPSRAKVALAGAAGVVVLGLVLGGRSWFEKQEMSSVPAAAPAKGAGALNPVFETRVINPVGDSWIDRGPMTSANLPLHVGDQLRFYVTLAEPRFVYIFWIDHEGVVTRKWPSDDADLEHQSPTAVIVNPTPDAQGQPLGWIMESSGGTEAVFIGVSANPLGAKELAEFEPQIKDLPQHLPSGQPLSVVEYPVRPKSYVSVDGKVEAVRGAAKSPVASKEQVTIDHRKFGKLFEAYQCWLFETK